MLVASEVMEKLRLRSFLFLLVERLGGKGRSGWGVCGGVSGAV